jgi:REP element-mobilizing transposase RayT
VRDEADKFVFPWEETITQAHQNPTIPIPTSRPVLDPTSLAATQRIPRRTPPPENQTPEAPKQVGSLSSFEPASAGLSNLAYTCILLPRLPQHYLSGEMAEKLGVWLPQISLAFGWRLEGIAIRPEYLQWTVQVLPAVSPGSLVRILRQRSSEKIFTVFPKLKYLNPSGDFWAPGYLIISGTQPPSPQLLRDFIAQTRRRQGLVTP